jgi:hypothetical protein
MSAAYIGSYSTCRPSVIVQTKETFAEAKQNKSEDIMYFALSTLILVLSFLDSKTWLLMFR